MKGCAYILISVFVLMLWLYSLFILFSSEQESEVKGKPRIGTGKK
jgi:hypothetical protein